MRELPEEGGTASSSRKPTQRSRNPKAKRSAGAAASPAKSSSRVRSRRPQLQESLPELEDVPAVALLRVPDQSPLPPDPNLQMLERRLQRLEAGLRLLADTFKRGFGELMGAIDSLHDDVARTATSDDPRRVFAGGEPTDSAVPAPEQRGMAAPSGRPVGKHSPDPASIWGENEPESTLVEAEGGPKNHRKRSAARRRLEKSWPGRAYSQWKWRRT